MNASKRLSRLPESDGSPTAFDRAGRVEDQPERRIAGHVEFLVERIELLLGDISEIVPDAGHR